MRRRIASNATTRASNPCLTKATLTVAILAVVQVSGNSSPAAAAPANSTQPKKSGEKLLDVLHLHQNSNVMGKIELYVCPSGMRFLGRSGDVTVVSSAPEWKTLLYCKSKNQALEVSPDDVKNSSLGIFSNPLPILNNKWPKTRDLVLNIPCQKLVIYPVMPTKSHDSFIFQDRNNKSIADCTLETANLCLLPKPLQKAVNWTYNFNNNNDDSLPIKSIVHYKGGGTMLQYETLAITHVKLPQSFFTAPTGYKKAANKVEVLLSNETNATLEELWGSKKEK